MNLADVLILGGRYDVDRALALRAAPRGSPDAPVVVKMYDAAKRCHHVLHEGAVDRASLAELGELDHRSTEL